MNIWIIVAIALFFSALCSGLEIAKSFDEWIKGEGISDYAAEITEADNVKTMFDAIKDEIIYMVGSGVVTDKITDEFELDQSAGGCPFKMTKDGESIAASSSGDNSWNFGTAIDGVYPYVVEYDESSKTIKWTINVPIENLKKITLSYDLILGEEYPSGTYDTNKSAVLEYTSTDGKHQGEYEFEKPKVVEKATNPFEVVDAEVVSALSTSDEVAEPQEELKCSDCGAVISDKVYSYSKNKYGKPLCYNCQKKVK